jgi:potassium-transporting ATPase ATP-binding subunit
MINDLVQFTLFVLILIALVVPMGIGGVFPAEVQAAVEEIARRGSTPLVVSDDKSVLGTIELKDIVKGGISERFAELRKWP